MIFNIDWNRFKNNKYLKNIENFISDSPHSARGDQSPILSPFNIINFSKKIKTLEKNSELLDQKIEPFKENVENIKELYDNIQNEINKLKEGNPSSSTHPI